MALATMILWDKRRSLPSGLSRVETSTTKPTTNREPIDRLKIWARMAGDLSWYGRGKTSLAEEEI